MLFTLELAAASASLPPTLTAWPPSTCCQQKCHLRGHAPRSAFLPVLLHLRTWICLDEQFGLCLALAPLGCGVFLTFSGQYAHLSQREGLSSG